MDVNTIAYMELHQVAELIRTRVLSSSELIEAMLARVTQFDTALHSHQVVMTDSARRAAARADAELDRGLYRGPLHGVPIGVKDLFYTSDAPTAAGTSVLAQLDTGVDATVVARLRRAGAVITGKLGMSEAAFHGVHPDFQLPLNPWDSGAWPGVSSAGSAVAVAAGFCFGALGSDTGGSIRFPSAMNAVTGVKPTWSRVSRAGAVPLAPSLDHVGPMARSARDAALLLAAIAGFDPLDPSSSRRPVPDYFASVAPDTAPRVGIASALIETFDAETQAMVDETARVLRDLGCVIVRVELPDLAPATAAFPILMGVEALTSHQQTYPRLEDDYGPMFRDYLRDAGGITASEYYRAHMTRLELRAQMEPVLRSVDALLMPAIGKAAPTLAEMSRIAEDDKLYSAVVTPTAPFNMTGSPCVTVPAGWTKRGVPMGIQFIGNEFTEHKLLALASSFQADTDHHRRRPPLTSGS